MGCQNVPLFNLNSARMYLKVPFPVGLLSGWESFQCSLLCNSWEGPASGTPLTSVCIYLHCAWNPDGDRLDMPTNSVSSGNLHSPPETAVHEAAPHRSPSNSPPDSRATFGSIGLQSRVFGALVCTLLSAHRAMPRLQQWRSPLPFQWEQISKQMSLQIA